MYTYTSAFIVIECMHIKYIGPSNFKPHHQPSSQKNQLNMINHCVCLSLIYRRHLTDGIRYQNKRRKHMCKGMTQNIKDRRKRECKEEVRKSHGWVTQNWSGVRVIFISKSD